MCLLTRQKEPIILKEDKIVWKILANNLEPIYFHYKYEFKVLNKTEIIIGCDPTGYSKKQGDLYRHSYPGDLKEGIISIEDGFHSFNDFDYVVKSLDKHEEEEERSIFECTIPAGSEYYEDETGLCASNQIIINKVL